MSNFTRKILNKILWKGKSKWLLLGAAFGEFVGLFLLLATLQFYFDIQKLLNGDANPSDQFVQINKKVNLFNTLGMSSSFTGEDIAKLEGLPFVNMVGRFTPNSFKVGASSDMLGFYTELFFESIPAEFLDVDEPDFRWSEGGNMVPVIISKDYLALYNFGFAPSQGLPQVTPSTLTKLKMELTISGNGKRQSFSGRIVGFSERINSILVPPDFMEWANENFGTEQESPARLILKVDNPLNKEFQAFLQEKGYEVSTGRLIGTQFSILLNIVLGVLGAISLLILALSMLVFILNFQLLIAQSKPEIRLLLETGHYPRQISGLLSSRFVLLFGGILVLVFLALITVRNWQVGFFENQGFELEHHIGVRVVVIGLAFCLGLILLNLFNIRKAVAFQTK